VFQCTAKVVGEKNTVQSKVWRVKTVEQGPMQHLQRTIGYNHNGKSNPYPYCGNSTGDNDFKASSKK